MSCGNKTHKRRFKGIKADAATLGVERTHLYRVLTEERPGAKLFKRYLALKLRQSTETKPPQTAQTRMNAKLLAQNNQLLTQLATAKQLATELQPQLPADPGALPDMPEIAEIDKAMEVVKQRIAKLEAQA